VSELGAVEVDARDGVPIMRIRGEMDLSNVDSIGATIREAVGSAAPGLIVDLSQLEYLDSSGVRLLFQVADALEERGRVMRAVVPSTAAIRRVLELADLAQRVPVDETEDAARALVLAHEPP
jgi:anti-anti-sigma factor